MRPKRTPESFRDQRRDQRDPEKVSRRRPKAPEAPQRPTKAEKYEKPIVKLLCLRKNIKFLFSKTKVLLKETLSDAPPQRGPKIGFGF